MKKENGEKRTEKVTVLNLEVLGKCERIKVEKYSLAPPINISRVAQRKRAGPITQRSMDRNHPLLCVVIFFIKSTSPTETFAKQKLDKSHQKKQSHQRWSHDHSHPLGFLGQEYLIFSAPAVFRSLQNNGKHYLVLTCLPLQLSTPSLLAWLSLREAQKTYVESKKLYI